MGSARKAAAFGFLSRQHDLWGRRKGTVACDPARLASGLDYLWGYATVKESSVMLRTDMPRPQRYRCWSEDPVRSRKAKIGVAGVHS